MVVFQVMEYGLEVSSEERLDPSSLNWTPTTPTASDAEAVTVVVVPLTVALLLGVVMETVGAVVSTVGVEAPVGRRTKAQNSGQVEVGVYDRPVGVATFVAAPFNGRLIVVLEEL